MMDIENIKNELKEHVLDSVKDEAKAATILSWVRAVMEADAQLAVALVRARQDQIGQLDTIGVLARILLAYP